MSKLKFQPRIAEEGFKAALEMARRWRVMEERKGSILRVDGHVCVTFDVQPYTHEEGATLDEAFDKADKKFSEEVKYRSHFDRRYAVKES